MKRLILLFAFVYGFILSMFMIGHLAFAEKGIVTTWIFFNFNVSEDDDLYRMNLDGSDLRNLTPVREWWETPEVIINNQWLIFTSYQKSSLRLYRMDLNTLERQFLFQEPNFFFSGITPDEKWLFVSGRYTPITYRMRPDGSEMQTVVQFSVYGRFSPDNQWMIFTAEIDNQVDIYRVQLDGSQLQNLTNSPAKEFNLQITPDGQWIVFELTDTREFYRMRLDGSEVQNISNSITQNLLNYYFGFSEQWLIFSSLQEAHSQIYRMRLDGSEVQNISNSPDDLFWKLTPDRNWILFTSRNNLEQSIYRMRLDGSQVENLTPIAGWSSNPEVTPDGRWIVFMHFQDEKGGIYRIDFEGKKLKKLISLPVPVNEATWTYANLPSITAHREALAGVGAVLMLGAILAGRRL
jgi:Tol biopolymer transport system component